MEDIVVKSIDDHITLWLRHNCDVTARDLAKEVGISPNSLRNKRRGKAPFTVEEIVRLCNITGTTPNEITNFHYY